MGRRLFYWELAGFLLTGALGTLLHFVYEWSGGSALAELPTLIAAAVRKELDGVGIYLNQRKVGELTTAWQANNARAWGV